MSAKPPLTHVVMRLARNPRAGFPDGDDNLGYVITAPLDQAGHLDPEQWRARKKYCAVIRFTPGEERDADGWLTHRGGHWYLHYDEDHEGPDEPICRLGEHRLRLGDYLTIHEAGGDDLTYKITETRPI